MRLSSKLIERIRRSRKALKNPYAHLDGNGCFDAVFPDPPADVHEARLRLGNQYAYLDENGGFSEWDKVHSHERHTGYPLLDIGDLVPSGKKDKYTHRELEDTARRVQSGLWQSRASLWGDQRVTPLDVLDPAVALEAVGFSTSMEESLGSYSDEFEAFEVAGILDNDKRAVFISRRFSPDIRKFTLAHELGHAILHEGTGLHRDRALNGSVNSQRKDIREYQADKFAAYFLMPEKQVRRVFEETFLMSSFEVNERSAFALGYESLDSLQEECPTVRDLSKRLTRATRFNGEHILSIADRFGVSIEAMAIRLEELRLVSI